MSPGLNLKENSSGFVFAIIGVMNEYQVTYCTSKSQETKIMMIDANSYVGAEEIFLFRCPQGVLLNLTLKSPAPRYFDNNFGKSALELKAQK